MLFRSNLPTFAVGAAGSYISEDEGWGLPTIPPVKGNQKLSWEIIEQVVADDFDISTCQAMKIDHAVTVPLQLLWPDGNWPEIIPVAVNTVQLPLPKARRCLQFGEAIGRALTSSKTEATVLVLSTGGLSHQLDGERAGFINPDFDAF